MPESIQDTLTRLLRYQRAPAKATLACRTWKHNIDILPRLQAQLEMLLDSHGKFVPVVYDTQGINDDGADIVLRYRSEGSDAEPELLGFQVKSFRDLSKKTYMQELKAQRDDAFRKVHGLRYYYIFLCTDSKAHKDRVRNVAAEFRSAELTEVIEPEYAFTFLHHPRARVEALVKRVMEADDLVFRLALESLDLPSPSARALIVHMVVRSATTGVRNFAVDDLLAELALRSVYSELSERQALLFATESRDSAEKDHNGDEPALSISASANDNGTDDPEWEDEPDEDQRPWQASAFEEQLAADLALLENDFVESDSTSGEAILSSEQLRPLNAVVTDALARYEYDEEQLLAYMFSLFGVRD